jgi:hypothetical protein
MVEATIPAGESAPAAEDNNAASANAPGSWETITLMERPSEIPEKFFKDGVLNVKELAKSYGELERVKGAPAPAANTETIPAKPAENVPAPVKIQEPMAIPGVAAPAVAKYTDELTSQGKLSDASYAELQKAGYPKTVVDAYIKGLTADQDQSAAVEGALIADKAITEITNSVGGQEVLSEMLAWATANLEPTDLEAYNKAVGSSDVSQVRLAVNGLYHAFSQAQAPGLLKGYKGSNFSTVEPFLSNDEVVTAMQNPKYDRDPAYRAMVAERIRVSDVFSQSKDLKQDKIAEGKFARYQS